MRVSFGFDLNFIRRNWERAVQYHSETLLQKHWLLLVGYVTNLRKERYRLEYRRSSLAVSHYKYSLSHLMTVSLITCVQEKIIEDSLAQMEIVSKNSSS